QEKRAMGSEAMRVLTSTGAKQLQAYAGEAARAVGWEPVCAGWRVDWGDAPDTYVLALAAESTTTDGEPPLTLELRFGRADIVGYGQGHGVEAIHATIIQAILAEARKPTA